ncbi:MAG: KpsF/GutQ family sugar-phosphate isomerase [Phycisphaerales bacterium]|nr:KpsF/GutQ family sugar-phosphate isomerase [Phycisphaerales bacterium]
MSQTPLDIARQVISAETRALEVLSDALDEQFELAARKIMACPASLITSGVGKAGHIARKVSATFSSTGTPSHFLSPADAVHGDLGAVRQGDLIMLFSSSGESDEILRLLSIFQKLGRSIISISATRNCTLARHADISLVTGKTGEACPLGLAPSASTTAMLALGDALALTVMSLRQFTAEDFALFHPGGQLGRKLIKVSEAMTFRLGENLPVVSQELTVGQALQQVSKIKRRSGALIMVDAQGKLSGIFSDGDLRRLIIADDQAALRRPLMQVMTHNPKRIPASALASQAMAILRQYRIDELPVVDDQDRPIGLIDVQDLVMLKIFDVDQT